MAEGWCLNTDVMTRGCCVPISPPTPASAPHQLLPMLAPALPHCNPQEKIKQENKEWLLTSKPILAERGKSELPLHRLHVSSSLFQPVKTLWTRARADARPGSGLCCCQIALCAQTRRASPWPSVNPRCVHAAALPTEIVLSWLLKHTSPPPQHAWGLLKQRSGVLPHPLSHLLCHCPQCQELRR